MMALSLLFFCVAVFYSSVGFGGGSSYLALLVLWGVDYAYIPIIALVCNIAVVSGNSIRYVRAGYVNWRLLLPPTIASVPFAYLGGRLELGQEQFLLLLFVTLLVSGIRMLLNYRSYDGKQASVRSLSHWASGAIGGVLGFIAGAVGIGGGIFLAPILYNLRAGTPKQIATTASLFILVNSIAGLLGQLHKIGFVAATAEYWFLPLLVLLGGQVGNIMTIRYIPARVVALLTALLVLFVAFRLGILAWEGG